MGANLECGFCSRSTREQTQQIPDPPEHNPHEEEAIDASTIEQQSDTQVVPWKPLAMTIIGARNLRNADFSFPFRKNLSDPYCVCEIAGKPLSRTVTDVVQDNLNPEWNHEAQFNDFEVGDALKFSIWDKDNIKRDDFLGCCYLSSAKFHPDGFEGELLLQEAGKNRQAFVKVRIEKAAKVDQPRPSKTVKKCEAEKFTTKTCVNRCTQCKPSGNSNKPGDFVWLEYCLDQLAANKAASLGCAGEHGDPLTPILFVIGGCPNSMCGIQAVMFAVSAKSVVDFWWVKPNKQSPKEIEHETLKRHETGKHKNAPGRSAPFYQPLADLFQQGVRVRDWEFGLAPANSESGTQIVRAFLRHGKAPDETLYILFMWQEDFPLNPFARSKYIKGKLVYQRSFGSAEYFSRQYELHDGAISIADFEEGPVSTVLPGESLKTLWDIRAGA